MLLEGVGEGILLEMGSTRLTFTCSKSIIEILERVMEYVQRRLQ